jgi:hypothetical protein
LINKSDPNRLLNWPQYHRQSRLVWPELEQHRSLIQQVVTAEEEGLAVRIIIAAHRAVL